MKIKVKQNKLFLNEACQFEVFENSSTLPFYSFIKNYTKKGYNQYVFSFEEMMKITEIFILKYSAKIINLDLLINNKEHQEDIDNMIENISYDRSEFLVLYEFLNRLNEVDGEEVNKISIKFRNNKLYKFSIYMSGLIEISDGNREEILNEIIKAIENTNAKIYS
ncbi:TPA: hypothetical protein SLC65_001103 [Staphylococcus aureus]|nr:hypothetical protein [Staphylococcus aureus]